jgi:hypothetical protein
MKKTLIIFGIIGLLVSVSSCKRSEVADPAWNSPAGFQILLEGSAAPALLLIDGRIHSSEIYVRVTDSMGNPLANKTVFLEQLADPTSYNHLSWGYFANNQSTYQKNTDVNGVIRVNFYWPLQYYSEEMWIHALLVIDGRAYKESENGKIGNIPQDYISLAMFKAN